ncbi:MAG TPA: isoprenyl transferase [Clostridia bacterium]|nr:isoprenyl transferase [Clostridia bacterium]
MFGRLFGNKKKDSIDLGKMPQHIAIIMDGNGRWAKKRGLPRNVGHRKGSENLRRIVSACNDFGIKYLTIYAFSTENWKRPKSEVDGLMSLLLEYLRNAEKELGGKDVRIRVIGEKAGLPKELQKEIVRVEKMTECNKSLVLNIALNYGSKVEILGAVKSIINDVKQGKLNINDIGEEAIEQRLYTSDMPDPDLLIRTSGEKRISNFLLWQCAYSEFWFTDVLWPDFGKEHLEEAIRIFQNRDRRFGGV